MSFGLFFLIMAGIVGFYWGFRDEINDLWQDIFGKRIDATPEKDRYEFRSWWHDQLSEEERDSYLRIVQNPLGADSDPQHPDNDSPATPEPD